MIVRKYAACMECGAGHVLRVGIGSERLQAHQFACANCGEEMSIRLETGVGTIYGPNAVEAEPDDTAPVVNLHPSFVFEKAEINSATAFPSLQIGPQLISAMLKARARAGLPTDFGSMAVNRMPRLTITEEWAELRSTWSLTRNGKHDLAARRMKAFLENGGYPEQPDSIADWLFQFAEKLCQPHFMSQWEEAFEQLRLAAQKDDFKRFAEHYGSQMSSDHGRRYFELMKAYFSSYSEFSQVHQAVASGIEINDDFAAASANFDNTRMFYGNAFEAFSSNVEVLTAINNLIAGRPFDALGSITLADYQKLDKAARFKAFETNPAFASISAEADNQLRNASHHGGMVFDRETGTISYRSGKGGKGNASDMGYARYLARCSKLFIQSMLLLRLELLLADQCGVRAPL